MRDAALRSRCEQRLSRLCVPEPFDLVVFCRELALRRGRPLTVRGMQSPEPGDPSGAWIATDEADYVFVDEDARPLHREHIVLHELAHIIFDHGTATGLAAGDAAALLPSLDSAMVARVLGRSRYTQLEEREAELLATMIAEKARGASRTSAGDQVQALRRRLRATLG